MKKIKSVFIALGTDSILWLSKCLPDNVNMVRIISFIQKIASRARKTCTKTIACCCANVCRREKGLGRILQNQVLVCTQNGNIKLTCGISTFFSLLQDFADEQFWPRIKPMFYKLYNTSLQNYTSSSTNCS